MLTCAARTLTGTIRRRLAWLLCKDGMQICEAFLVFKWQKKNTQKIIVHSFKGQGSQSPRQVYCLVRPRCTEYKWKERTGQTPSHEPFMRVANPTYESTAFMTQSFLKAKPHPQH